MDLLEKLEILMAEKGITRAELAKGAGVPYQTIASFYSKGTDNIKLSTLRKLSDFFDVSLDYIADDSVTDRDYGRVITTIDVDTPTALMLEKYKLLNAEGRKVMSLFLDGMIMNKQYLNGN